MVSGTGIIETLAVALYPETFAGCGYTSSITHLEATNVASDPALQRSEPSMLRCRVHRPQRRAAFHRASPVAARRSESSKPATRYSACPQRRNLALCADVRWRRGQPGAVAPAPEASRAAPA